MKKLLVLTLVLLPLAGCSASIGTNPPATSTTTYTTPVASSTTYTQPAVTRTTVTRTN